MASRKGGTEYRKRVECDKVSNSENKPPKSPRFILYTGTVPEDFVPLLKTEAAKLCIIYKDFFWLISSTVLLCSQGICGVDISHSMGLLTDDRKIFHLSLSILPGPVSQHRFPFHFQQII